MYCVVASSLVTQDGHNYVVCLFFVVQGIERLLRLAGLRASLQRKQINAVFVSAKPPPAL